MYRTYEYVEQTQRRTIKMEIRFYFIRNLEERDIRRFRLFVCDVRVRQLEKYRHDEDDL